MNAVTEAIVSAAGYTRDNEPHGNAESVCRCFLAALTGGLEGRRQPGASDPDIESALRAVRSVRALYSRADAIEEESE